MSSYHELHAYIMFYKSLVKIISLCLFAYLKCVIITSTRHLKYNRTSNGWNSFLTYNTHFYIYFLKEVINWYILITYFRGKKKKYVFWYDYPMSSKIVVETGGVPEKQNQ